MIKFFLYLLGINQGESELPDNARNIIRAREHDSNVVVYHAEYSDGCHETHFDDGSTNWGGPKHAPHAYFHPGDKPVKEWKQQ